MSDMLVIEGLKKGFNARGGTRIQAVDNVSLSVPQGALLTLLGPSGCGKTTILRCIAGLEQPDEGRIVIGDRVVFDSAAGILVPANQRGIGMVFQSYAIWPHMSVKENVAFPLKVARDRKYSRQDINEKVARALEMVRLGGFEDRSATQLSGGQQQRLALARGLVREPALLLLDEPLSNLDAKLREEMRFELKRLQLELGLTALYVTHDQSEALALSDQIAVFSSGKAIQLGDPVEIYRRPATRFVADFIGTTNFLPGKAGVPGDDGKGAAFTDFGTVACRFARSVKEGDELLVLVRPEDTGLAPATENVPNGIAGTIENRVYLGEFMDYVVRVRDVSLRVRTKPDTDFAIGEEAKLVLPEDRCFGLPRAEAAALTA